MNNNKRNINKDAKFANVSKSARLYGLDPIWKVTIKVGLTGLIMSFFLGLFTFVDQLMLVNFMPTTHNYSFNSLFYAKGQGLFDPMLNYINANGGNEIINHIKSQIGTDKDGLLNLTTAIANTIGLTVFDSAGVVRSGVSLIGALSIIINSIPSLFAVGTSVKYTQALGKGDYKKAAFVWQNAFVGCITSGLICFALLIILIPTVIPAQAVSDNLSKNEIYGLYSLAEKNLSQNHWDFSDIFFENSNGQLIDKIYFMKNDDVYTYYVKVSQDEYLNISNNQLIDPTLNDQLLTKNVNSNNHFNILVYDPSTNSNSSILSVWNHYYAQVRTYSIRWAEDFMFIMDAGCTIFALSNLLGVILRSEGAIAVSTTITIVTVLFNILLDFIFIKIAQIGMEGAATASVIGWIVQFVWSALYIQYSKKIKSVANFNVLNKKYFYFSWKIMGEIALFGLSMLIGTVSFSISNIILTNQVTYVTVQIIPQVGGEYYLSIMGAVTPIVNLFFFTVFGLIRSNSPIFAYNYSARRTDRVRAAYWWNIVIIVGIGGIILGLIGFCDPITFGILNWFQINQNSPDYQLESAHKLIWLWLMQIPIMGFATGGMLMYRSTNRLGTSYLVALLRSCIYNIPMIFIFMSIAINCKDSLNAGLSEQEIGLPYENNAMWFFFYNLPVAAGCYSLTIFIMTTIFIYKYLDLNPRRKVSEIWPNSLFINYYYKKMFNESNIKVLN